jgi:hypothetical protein
LTLLVSKDALGASQHLIDLFTEELLWQANEQRKKEGLSQAVAVEHIEKILPRFMMDW